MNLCAAREKYSEALNQRRYFKFTEEFLSWTKNRIVLTGDFHLVLFNFNFFHVGIEITETSFAFYDTFSVTVNLIFKSNPVE